MSALIAKDKEEAEKREVKEKAEHSIHRVRLDELAATISEQDARIRELEAKILSAPMSDSSTPGAKCCKTK